MRGGTDGNHARGAGAAGRWNRHRRPGRRRRRRCPRGAYAAYTEAAGAATLLLDFGDVAYINSTGIALIVGLLGRARADGVAVAACGLSDHYRQIFEITRLSDFMSIHADERSARAATQGGAR